MYTYIHTCIDRKLLEGSQIQPHNVDAGRKQQESCKGNDVLEWALRVSEQELCVLQVAFFFACNWHVVYTFYMHVR
jgi:hypothetical protein